MFIRTANLLLRPGWVDDAPALTQAFARQEVIMTLARAPWPYELEDAVAYLGRERQADEVGLLIFLRTPGAPTLIGGIGLVDVQGVTELGYWIVPSHWNRGYATEAGHAVIAAARDSLRIDRLGSRHFTGNRASARVLEKLGFRATGNIEPRECRALGVLADSATYALDLHETVAA